MDRVFLPSVKALVPLHTSARRRSKTRDRGADRVCQGARRRRPENSDKRVRVRLESAEDDGRGVLLEEADTSLY